MRADEGQPPPVDRRHGAHRRAPGQAALVRRRLRQTHAGMNALALPALDRPPRRRQAGAREHAGGLPPRRRARLSHVRVRRQAQRRRRALPAARRHAGAHQQRPRHRRRAALGRAGAARRRRLAFAPLRRRAAAHARRPDRASASPTATALNIEIKPTPGVERAHRRGGRAARRAAVGRRGRRAAAADLLRSPNRCAARCDAQPELPRGLLLDTLRDGWLDTARELGCAAIVCNYALWDAATVAQVHAAGLRALSYTVNDEWAAAAADRARHRRHHHRPRRPVQSRRPERRARRRHASALL